MGKRLCEDIVKAYKDIDTDEKGMPAACNFIFMK
jgi:hypothetical protein